ncbi:hypothetical protein EYF80_001300 [Liparis tanakae]|uniref:Uncharacterized protein n=1 Tax=Liparis tanakae TaxID=230148 RepID=A0A4Z2JEX3_9TELE|nr:hypothetical protein EYF80_001300 [Liparis tanakae]
MPAEPDVSDFLCLDLFFDAGSTLACELNGVNIQQPRLISIVSILSSLRMVLASGLSLLREIFNLLVQPWKTSSRETLSSWMMAGSCFRRCGPPGPTCPSRGNPFMLKLVKEPKGSFPSTSMSSSSRPLALRPKNISKGFEAPKKVAKVA